MLEERNEPRQGCFGSLRREKGGLRERFRGLAQDKLLLPIASLVASLMGSLRVKEMQTGGEGVDVLPGRGVL